MYKYFLTLFLSFSTISISAQFHGGISLDDGVYKAHKMVNNEPDANSLSIAQIPLGNGIQVYMDAEKNTYLDGTYYLLQKGNNNYTVVSLSKGLLDGECQSYWQGYLFRKMTYNKGLLNGTEYRYFDNGSPRNQTDYVNGIPTKAIEYYQNGQEVITVTFDKHGLKDGLLITYNQDGSKKDETNYKHGRIEGKSIEYKADGSKEIKNYKGGNFPEGEYIVTYPNGKTKIQGEYGDEYRNVGKWIEYNEDGSKKSEIHYKRGSQDGPTTIYFDNGNVKSYTEYKDGKKNGIQKEYQEHPYVLLSEATYKENSLDGEYKGYEDGVLWRDCIYKDGKMVYEKQYLNGKIKVLKMLDESGNMVDVNKYDTAGKSVYKNKTYKKHYAVRLVEDESGIIDFE